MVKQSAVDRALPHVGKMSDDCRRSMLTALDVAKKDLPPEDAKFLKDNYPITLSYDEELRAAADFTKLAVLPTLPEIGAVLDFFRKIQKGSPMKPANGNGNGSGINLLDLPPEELPKNGGAA